MQPYLFSWFDFVTVIMIAVGVYVGRRRGMSAEILDLLLWAAVVALGGVFTPGFGDWLINTVHFSVTTAYILAYILIAVAVLGIGFGIRYVIGEKLVSSDLFGNMEYYLGMIAGVVRFLCIQLAIMAILHGPYISQEDLQRQLDTQRRDLGEIYFPPFGQIQKNIFKVSLTGRTVDKYLHFSLINTGSGTNRRPNETIFRERERDVDAAGGLR
jgi:uncharacterized membrane protein required for colicin V production